MPEDAPSPKTGREKLAEVRALSKQLTEERLELRRELGELKDEVKKPLPESLQLNVAPTECEVMRETYQDLFAAARLVVDNSRRLPGLAERDFDEMLERTVETVDFMIEASDDYDVGEISGQLKAARNSLQKKRRFGAVERIMSRFMQGMSDLYVGDMSKCLYNVDLGHALSTQGHEFRRECEKRFAEKKWR
jgi:hypothetical protein